MKKIILISIVIFLSGCGVLTLNGQPSVKVEGLNNVYRFRVFRNSVPSENEIINFAHMAAAELAKSKQCKAYELAQLLPQAGQDTNTHIDFLAILTCE